MNQLTIYDLINKLEKYSNEEVQMVFRAYKLADELHNGQIRSDKKISDCEIFETEVLSIYILI